MPDVDSAFSPYFVTGVYELMREWGWLDFTIAGGVPARVIGQVVLGDDGKVNLIYSDEK